MTKEKQLPTFEGINKYNEETQAQQALSQKHAAQVNEAQALVSSLEYLYEQELKKVVTEGKDGSEQLEQLSEQLNKAERDLSNKKRMQQVARSVGKRSVSKEDIEQQLRAFQNRYQSEVIAPSEKELRKFKEAYINAFLEHMNKINHFDNVARSAFFTVNPSYNGYNIPFEVGFKTQDNRRQKLITSEDLTALERGQKPSSLKPLTKTIKDDNGHIHYVPIEEGENS
jgi:multidrug efflux pump subunit AcrA (membrane-fusion protein)